MTSSHIWVMGWAFWIVAMLSGSWVRFPLGVYGIFCIIAGYLLAKEEREEKPQVDKEVMK